ncbi:MAG: hypothetical protein ACTHU0_38915 [Kofleriaceae bacterium]
MTDRPPGPAQPGPRPGAGKPRLGDRLGALFSEYGRIAVITYLVLSIAAIAGFAIAIGVGAKPSTATGVFGVIGAGWLAAKATMPIRILVTLGVTPVIAAVIRRVRPRPAAEGAETSSATETAEAE